MSYYKFSERTFTIRPEVSKANPFSRRIQNLAQQFTCHNVIIKTYSKA